MATTDTDNFFGGGSAASSSGVAAGTVMPMAYNASPDWILCNGASTWKRLNTDPILNDQMTTSWFDTGAGVPYATTGSLDLVDYAYRTDGGGAMFLTRDVNSGSPKNFPALYFTNDGVNFIKKQTNFFPNAGGSTHPSTVSGWQIFSLFNIIVATGSLSHNGSKWVLYRFYLPTNASVPANAGVFLTVSTSTDDGASWTTSKVVGNCGTLYADAWVTPLIFRTCCNPANGKSISYTRFVEPWNATSGRQDFCYVSDDFNTFTSVPISDMLLPLSFQNVMNIVPFGSGFACEYGYFVGSTFTRWSLPFKSTLISGLGATLENTFKNVYYGNSDGYLLAQAHSGDIYLTKDQGSTWKNLGPVLTGSSVSSLQPRSYGSVVKFGSNYYSSADSKQSADLETWVSRVTGTLGSGVTTTYPIGSSLAFTSGARSFVSTGALTGFSQAISITSLLNATEIGARSGGGSIIRVPINYYMKIR